MDEVEQQAEEAQKFEAAIAALEPFVVQAANAQFSFDDLDLKSLDVDRELLQSLQESLADLNASLMSGEIALADIQTTTPGVGVG